MLKTLLDWVAKHFPSEDAVRLLRQLSRRRFLTVLTTVSLLTIAIGLGYYYWMRSTRYESVVHQTLKHELMPTPQIFKGLEAFIISSLPSNPESELSKKQFSGAFIDALGEIEAQLSKKELNGTITNLVSETVPSNLLLAPGNGGIVLTDSNSQGFLFLPAQILRPTFTEAQSSLFKQDADKRARDTLITSTLKTDPELVRDINFTAIIAPALEHLANTVVTTTTTDKPKQIYVITKNGVNRIKSANAGGIEAYQFPDTTFFPERPYFWTVFDEIEPRRARSLHEIKPPDSAKVGDYFKVSKPYMDLGGSGLVVTLSRGIVVDGYPRSVLCIDLPVLASTPLDELIDERVRTLGGYTMFVNCDVVSTFECSEDPDRHSSEKYSVNDPLLVHMRAALQDRNVRHRRAEILGNIVVLNNNKTQSDETGQLYSDDSADSIEASLPLGPERSGRERFLLLSMNLILFRRLTTLIGVGAATAIGLVTLLLSFVWGMQVKQSHDYELAFEKIAQVMTESPAPYVRLNSHDVIRDFSGSFLELLGCSPDDAHRLKNRTLVSLLASDSSRETYATVSGRRASGQDVLPYHLTLRRLDGRTVTVRVVSAAVPDSKGTVAQETFGLLLRPDEEHAVPLELVTAARMQLRRDAS